MWRKTFIGYDLGDGETITDLITVAEPDVYGATKLTGLIQLMTMPDSNTPATAIPTAYGYDKSGRLVFASSILADMEEIHDICNNFKRRPTDLIMKTTPQRQLEMIPLFDDGKWPEKKDCPEIYTEKMKSFSESVISFTNAIFEYPEYKEYIRSASVDSDEITFCVGHPTRWSGLDVAIYKAILFKSVLGKGAYAGKKTSIVMGAESRAAFLYCKDYADASVLPKDTRALLIDVGSSTIDVTAMTSDSRNYQYNSGNNYLGARGIDFLIRDWYLKQLKQDEEDWEVYQETVAHNPSFELGVTLACRMAKEKVYTVKAGKAKIDVGDFDTVKIGMDTIDKLVSTQSIAPVLKQYIGLPDEQVAAMGGKTWKELFRQFMMECRSEMKAQDINVGRIILTGSASRMPFVPEIVSEVFSDLHGNGILKDMNPARSISMGLSLVGPFNEKSKAFQVEIKKLIEDDVPQIVSDDVGKLADGISPVIEGVVVGIVKNRMCEWRRGRIKTLNQMSSLIKQDCSEANLTEILESNTAYNAAIKKWMVEVVGNDVAQKLESVCHKFGVTSFNVTELNVLKVPSFTIDMGGDPTDIGAMLAGLIGVIAGVITYMVLPFVLGVILGIIMLISTSIASLLISILFAIPGIGWTILLGLAGFAVFNSFKNGDNGAKSFIEEKIKDADLPQWVRDRMTDQKIDAKIKEANLSYKIKSAIVTDESKMKIGNAVTANLKSQIEKKADDIKYVIESK